ncbi:MAG: hypothetical protein IIC30_01340, partial [Chloroflexi bacterium]|nr:hypothetical protein [Chloroflexota bacterium]
MSEQHPEPKPFPISPDFPITWANPEDANLPWMHDRQHAPGPITPLSGWVCENYWGKGSSAGLAAAGQPIGIRIAHINTYYYNSIFPTIPPEQMAEAGRRAEEMLKQAIPTFAKRWDEEWLPELQGYHKTWDVFDLSGASVDELLAHLDWSLDTYARLWDIHFEVAIPFLVAPSMFHDLYQDVFGEAESLHSYKLLQGIENFSFVAGRELWSLSQKANTEAVRSVILDTPTSGVVAALETASGGGEFLGYLRSYLGDFGTRSDTIVELADPSWIEDPTIAIENLKHYLSEGAQDPAQNWNQLIAEREHFVAEARQKLAGYPEAVRGQFEMFMTAGQDGHRIQEDHNWWIDQKGNHQVRHVFLEFGRRLAAAGVITERDDVFYLTGDEIKDAIIAESPASFASAVTDRKAEMERWSKVPAPPMIGTDYGPPPDNPVTRAIGRFFGGPPPTPDPERPDIIKGNPGSPGTVTGTARVIIKLRDAGRLSRGEILVTATTAPPWTPLFATAGGIVTDTGGPLSHCAIVAREYGLPAVVGSGMATAV